MGWSRAVGRCAACPKRAANRLISTTANYSPTIYPSHGPDDDWNLTTAYGYDPVGNQTVVTDPSGVATYLAYDALGRLIENRDPLTNTTRAPRFSAALAMA